MNLIPEWRDAWRFLSVQANALGTAVVGSWAILPAGLKEELPQDWVMVLAAALFVLGIVGRLAPQPKTQAKIANRRKA